MHIPDGLLDPKVSIGLMGAAVAVLGYSLAKVREAVTVLAPQRAFALAGKAAGNLTDGSRRVLSKIGQKKLYQMGAITALIFIAQLFDFSIGGGTTGHLFGGVLAVVLLGPFAGTVTIAAVLTTQALFLGDGGLLALGANIINMAVIGVFISYYIYSSLKKVLPEWVSIAIASWLSVVLAATGCALEIAVSGTNALSIVLPAMLKVHVVVGLAEALLTLAIVSLLRLTIFKD